MALYLIVIFCQVLIGVFLIIQASLRNKTPLAIGITVTTLAVVFMTSHLL